MELVIILALVLVIFGATRLPQLGEGLGKGLRQFRRGVSGDAEQAGNSEAKEHRDHPTVRE
ncbi:MAG: twin-arginine translocase TatA/TatE family subunit [Chloroflexota bacterium]|nr:twin-arginine translocase TatA/TatE family subunit [Chloroflexota bacterium]